MWDKILNEIPNMGDHMLFLAMTSNNRYIYKHLILPPLFSSCLINKELYVKQGREILATSTDFCLEQQGQDFRRHNSTQSSHTPALSPPPPGLKS